MTKNTPQIDLGQDTTICPGDSLVLNAYSRGSSYLWQNGYDQPYFTVFTAGMYSVQVDNGCAIKNDTIRVSITSYNQKALPNVITPNGDRWNEYFELPENLVGQRLEIYDRWGKTVFHSDDYHNDWNGANLTSGVYYYQISQTCPFEPITGWLQVLK